MLALDTAFPPVTKCVVEGDGATALGRMSNNYLGGVVFRRIFFELSAWPSSENIQIAGRYVRERELL